MKKLLTILLLMIIPFMGLSQFSQNKIKLTQTDKDAIGYGMIIGGVSLTLGVAFTPQEYTGGVGSVRKPYYEQPAQLAGLITGPIISVGGLFTVLANRKGKKRKFKRRK